MLKYIFKNLKSQFTKQGVISLLLVVNIVVSALVICFSYGLYINYNLEVKDKSDDEITNLSIFVYEEKVSAIAGSKVLYGVVDITPQMVCDFVLSLSEETKENLSNCWAEFYIETPLFYDGGSEYAMNSEGEIEIGFSSSRPVNPETDYYSDDADAFYGNFTFNFSVEGDRIIPDKNGDVFTQQQYDDKEKVAVVYSNCFQEPPGGTIFANFSNGYIHRLVRRILPKGTESIKIESDYYKIIEIIQVPEGEYPPQDCFITITSAPQNAILWCSSKSEDGTINGGVELSFYEPVTRKQFDDIRESLNKTMGDYAYIPDVELSDFTEINYYRSVIFISVIIAILAAINMAILYRYILEKRSPELAIFRICGCSKAKAVMSYLIECMLINAPLFALTQLCYHKLIMPKLSDLFPHMQGAYSFKLYAAIFGIYVVASLVVMLIMIVATIRKHSLVEQKNSSKAKTRFGIMKLFEVLQFAIVLATVILIISAIQSRSSFFKPIEDISQRQGYMCIVNSDLNILKSDLTEIFPEYEIITTTQEGFVLENTNYRGLAYCDEFIKRYKPAMSQGVWLSDTDLTYENSGCIPIVMTYNSGYNVNDIIGFEAIMEMDENGNAIKTLDVKYKVVGVLADKVNIISFNVGSETENDYTDMYGVFSSSFEDSLLYLAREEDVDACYQTGLSPLQGVQFILTDNLSEEDFAELGEVLKGFEIKSAPLSEVNKNSLEYIYEQMYTLFPIALCIFILTVISAVSINAIYTKRQLRNYAIFYICGARWRTCALKSLKDSAITCAVASALCALILFIGKQSFLKETVISFGIWHAVICVAVISLYLLLSMIMPIAIIGSSQPKDVLKEE